MKQPSSDKVPRSLMDLEPAVPVSGGEEIQRLCDGPRRGRPYVRSDKAKAILDAVSEGASLREACRRFGIPKSTARGWFEEGAPFSAQYARARARGADSLFDQMGDLADECLAAVRTSPPELASAVVQSYRLRIDTLKWRLARMAPKKYGDKVEVTADKPLPTTVLVIHGHEIAL